MIRSRPPWPFPNNQSLYETRGGSGIQDQIGAGRQIIDIGPDPGYENFPGVTSDGCSIELQAIENPAYDNVIHLPYALPSGAGAP